MAKKGNWVCEWCGKDCGNPPALELHKKFCKRKNDSVNNGINNGNCEHEFRLLNPQNYAEKLALENQYLQVCTKCKELK